MKLVVTGALGHIGSRLVRSFSPQEFTEVVLIDNLATQRYASLFELRGDIDWRFIEADICAPGLDLESHFEGAHCVVHLAAITDATASFEMKADVERVNSAGTERVARACIAAGAPLLFPSTTSVYGLSDGLVDEASPAALLRPQSPYAESKLRSERLLAELGATAGLRFFAGRFGTIYGPSAGMRFHTAVNKFIWQACVGQPLSVWRTALDQKRPYLDLDDAVEAIRFVLRTGLFSNEIFNVVTGNHVLRAVIEAIRRRVPGLRVELVDSPIMNQYSYEVGKRKIEARGFRFRGDLERGISETVELLRPLAAGRVRLRGQQSLAVAGLDGS